MKDAGSRRETVGISDVAWVLRGPGVLFFALVGALLVAFDWLVLGVGAFALAGWRVARALGDPELPRTRRLALLQQRHRVNRLLSSKERAELLAVEEYARALVAAGAERALGDDTIAQAWALVVASGQNDAAEAVRSFRASLPAIDASDLGGKPEGDALHERLAREVAILNKTTRELNRL